MALTDLVIPSCLNPQFFMEKIDTSKKGVWFDICGGAAPVSGTIVNINEIVPSVYAARAAQVIAFNNAAPRMQQLVLAKYDYANQVRPDIAAQDQGKAIERDMLKAAWKANVFGDALLATAITANPASIDGIAVIGAHGAQTNVLASGNADATLTRAQADVAITNGLNTMRGLLDDATGAIDLPNQYAQKFVVVTGSTKRYSLYQQAKFDHTGNSVLPGLCEENDISFRLIANMPAKADLIFRLDGEPAFLSGVYGEEIWAGHDPYQNVHKWYHTFNQGMLPFRWQSLFEVTYT